MRKSKLFFLVILFFTTTTLFAQPFNKDDVNNFDQLFMQPYSKTLDRAGDIFTIASVAAPLVLLSTPTDQWLTEGIMFAESCLLSLGIEETGKYFVNRTRPYMYFDNYPQDEYENGDYLNSWPSAHTTMAFTGAAFTSYVFYKYYPDSLWNFAVIGGTYALAAATAACRVASGNHFATDVLSGAAIGTLSGFIVPFLHTLVTKKMPESDDIQVQASPFNLLIQFKF